MGDPKRKTKEDDYERIPIERASYEMVRSQHKLGTTATFFVLFKSCVGLGMFSYPYAFSKAGMIYGAILTVVMCYISTYGMYISLKSAERIERNYPVRFPTYQSSFLSRGLMAFLAEKRLGPSWVKAAKSVSVIGCVAINGSIIIGGVVEASEVLSHYFDFSQLILKLIILGTVLLITMVCLEPEKLKPVGYLSGGVIIAIGSRC